LSSKRGINEPHRPIPSSRFCCASAFRCERVGNDLQLVAVDRLARCHDADGGAMKQTIAKLREFVAVYRLYRAHHSAIYAATRAREIVFCGIPF
jgi:hypothetical protein